MIRIKAIIRKCVEIDESGMPVEKDVLEPESIVPSNAVRVECDGAFYTVYEQAD